MPPEPMSCVALCLAHTSLRPQFGKKPVKKAVKKAVKKTVINPRRRAAHLTRRFKIVVLMTQTPRRSQAGGEPNIIKKIFAMPLIGGAKGVELGDEYKL